MSTNPGSTSPQLTEVRVRHLFSKFRSRMSNPEGFDSKLNYWIGAINDWSAQERKYHFNLIQLSKAFKKFNLIPDLECLKLVASHLKRQNNLVSREYFVNTICANQGNGQGWISWGLGSLSKPLKFGFSLFGGQDEKDLVETIDPSITNSCELINVNAVTNGAKEFMNLLSEKQMVEKCLEFKKFEKSMVEAFKIDPDQMEILLLYLTSTKQAITMEDKGIKYIKFGDNVRFNDFDIGLRRLEAAHLLIEEDISKVEHQIEKTLEEARAAIRCSNKSRAKALLMKKKYLEDVLSKKEAQLCNINCLSAQLDNAHSNTAVVEAYKKCTEALKSAELENVDSTISNIEDTFESQNEVLAELGRGMSFNLVTVDEEDLESELKAFLETDDKKPEKEDDENKKLEELYARLENLRRPMRNSSPTNEPAARKIARLAD